MGERCACGASDLESLLEAEAGLLAPCSCVPWCDASEGNVLIGVPAYLLAAAVRALADALRCGVPVRWVDHRPTALGAAMSEVAVARAVVEGYAADGDEAGRLAAVEQLERILASALAAEEPVESVQLWVSVEDLAAQLSPPGRVCCREGSAQWPLAGPLRWKTSANRGTVAAEFIAGAMGGTAVIGPVEIALPKSDGGSQF